MGNYEQLKQAVSDVIKTNGNQEITGEIMQNALLSIISTVGGNATFAGIATPDTNPGTPDQNVFYIAAKDGIYVNFNNTKLYNNIVVFSNKNGNWETLYCDIPNISSINNISKSILTIDNVYIPLIIKSKNRLYTYIFTANNVDNVTNITINNTEDFEIILGTGNQPDLSDEVFLDDWTNIINPSTINTYNYWRITVRRKDGGNLNLGDVLLYADNTIAKNKQDIAQNKQDIAGLENVSLPLLVKSNISVYTPIFSREASNNINEAIVSDDTTFEIILGAGNQPDLSDEVFLDDWTNKLDLTHNTYLYYRITVRRKDLGNLQPQDVKVLIGYVIHSNSIKNIYNAIAQNTQNIAQNTQNIAQNTQDITVLGNLLIDNVNISMPKTEKILLTGASFATANGSDSGWEPEINGYNRWFENACNIMGINGINHAIGGQSIINTANMMLDAGEDKPHGTLFMNNGSDVFDDVYVFVIMHVHNQDVNYIGNKTLEDYKSQGINGYAEAYDYVIKQYMKWCLDAKDDSQSKYYGVQYGKPFQMLLCTHWHDARTIFNNSVRKLCKKTGISLCRFDDKVGFSKNYPNPSGLQESCYHSWSPDGSIAGSVEVIDGVTYGWHMEKPKYTSLEEYTLPYIQRKISSIFRDCFTIEE